MGEIGIGRLEYLYDLNYCDLLMIERGYYRRSRDAWSASRWSTYHMMAAFCGSKALNENGIYHPKDLIEFPWDNEQEAVNLTDQEYEDMQAEMAAFNAANAQSG